MHSESNRFLQSILFPLFFLLLIWMVFYFNLSYELDLNRFGVKPRTLTGLTGIFFMPLLHGDFMHITSNSFPLLVLGTCLFYFYREIAYPVFFISYFLCSFLVWLFARNDAPHGAQVHIGASGLIYALAGFLFVSGIIRKHKALFGISLLITFLYGTIIWGVLPGEYQKAIHYVEDGRNISWEGHLFGFLSGIILAFAYRKTGIQRPEYSWEINPEDEPDESDPYWMVPEDGMEKKAEAFSENPRQEKTETPVTVRYTFIPREHTNPDPPKDIK